MRDFKIIKARCGGEIKVSPEDYDRLSQYKWYLMKGKHKSALPYARTSINRRVVAMHRMILDPGPGRCVDHINRDSLDNRRDNLRPATRGENRVNSKDTIRKSGLPRNIQPAPKPTGMYYAVEIRRNGRRINRKLFKKVEDAVVHRDAVLKSLSD